MGQGTSPIVVALIRAVLGGFVTAGTVFLGTWRATDDPKTLIIATGLALFGYIASRGGLEGAYDQKTKPDMNSSPPVAPVDSALNREAGPLE